MSGLCIRFHTAKNISFFLPAFAAIKKKSENFISFFFILFFPLFVKKKRRKCPEIYQSLWKVLLLCTKCWRASSVLVRRLQYQRRKKEFRLSREFCSLFCFVFKKKHTLCGCSKLFGCYKRKEGVHVWKSKKERNKMTKHNRELFMEIFLSELSREARSLGTNRVEKHKWQPLLLWRHTHTQKRIYS